MDNSNLKNTALNYDAEIDFKELFQIIWDSKIFVSAITFIFLVIAISYSLLQPNIYQSNALLSPMESRGGLSNALGNYSGIATIAGINIPSQDSDSNAVKSIEKLKSLSFFSENILPNIFLPDLMAIKSWDSASNIISYDEDIYDSSEQLWVRDFQYPQNQVPSAQEAFKIFMNEHLNVDKDIDTGFVTISIKHQSPFIAKNWTEVIVDQLNDFYRIKDKAEAEAAVAFLNMQIAQTGYSEIKEVIAELIQQKTQQLALIEVSKFYVFEYLDPPAAMEQKSQPNRVLICLFGIFLGGFIGILTVMLRHYAFKNDSQ